MSRKIEGHEFGAAGTNLRITVLDQPGPGGASSIYHVKWPTSTLTIPFQDGPVPEQGVNGVTEAALLVIIVDRLRSFQAGQFACRENALALTKIEEALHWLQERTRDREARGVEGEIWRGTTRP